MDYIVPTLIISAIVGFYFLPSIIATGRKIESADSLVLVNLLFGWTLIGWIACLLWAIIGKGKDTRQVIYVTKEDLTKLTT